MHFYEDTPSSCIWNGYFWEIFGHHSNTIIHGLDNKFDAYGSMINVRDGRKYSVQNYGDQVWMTDNLQTEKYHYHGEYYDDIDETGKNSKYGKLYSVDVISDAVPKGWHIPSIEEWRKLFSYLEKKDIIIKKGENYWKEPYRTGFAKWFINPSMAGGGYIQNSNSKNDFKFANLKKKAYYWSSSKANNGSSYIVSMSRKGIFIETAIDESKLSVRCIQDNPTILYQVKDSNNSKVVYKGDDSYSITLSNKNDFLQGVGIPEDKKVEMGDYYIDLKTGVYFEKNKKRWIVQNISFAVKNELIPYLIKCESLVTLVESGISVEELRKSCATLRDFLNYKKPNKITIKLLYDGGFTLREFKSVSKIYQYGISDEDLKEAGLLGTFKDERDNKKYKWVKIGNQVWMAENLKYIPKVDSMQIAMYQKKLAEYCKDEGYEYSEASKRYVKKTGTARKYLYYLDAPPHPVLKFLYRYKEFNKINYSCKLYNWSSFLNLDAKYDSTINTQPINELKTIAPKGWHIPSIEEWQELIQYISTQNNVKFEKSSSYPNIGYSIKGTKSWFKRRERYAGSPVDSLNGDDEFGFSALAVGYGMMSDSKASKYKKYSYENRSKSTIWWTSTESSNNSAVTIEISSDTLTIHDGDKRNLYSIRCVKDSE